MPWDVNLELYFHVSIGFRVFFFPFNLGLSINIDSLNSTFTLVEQQGLLTCLSLPVHALLRNAEKRFFPLSHIIFLKVSDYMRLHFWGQDENFDWSSLHRGLVCILGKGKKSEEETLTWRDFQSGLLWSSAKSPHKLLSAPRYINSTFVWRDHPLDVQWDKWGFPHLQHLDCSLLDLASCCTQPCSHRDGLQHLSVFASWLAHYPEWCNCEFSCRQKGRSVAAFAAFL